MAHSLHADCSARNRPYFNGSYRSGPLVPLCFGLAMSIVFLRLQLSFLLVFIAGTIIRNVSRQFQ